MNRDENNFRENLTKKLKAAFGSKIFIHKTHGGYVSSGMPDIYAALNGASVWAELKAVRMVDALWWQHIPAAGMPTLLQRVVLHDMRVAGLRTRVLVVNATRMEVCSIDSGSASDYVEAGIPFVDGSDAIFAWAGISGLRDKNDLGKALREVLFGRTLRQAA